MSEHADAAIDALLAEHRTFPPSDEFRANALLSDPGVYASAAADDEAFWAQQATELIDWAEPWHATLEWDLPYAKWFVGGKLNVSHNCLDRHVAAGLGDRLAIHWEGEPGDSRTITYAELLAEVQRFANVLRELGVGKGDRVNIYLPMIPEAAVAMLAKDDRTIAEIGRNVGWNDPFHFSRTFKRFMGMSPKAYRDRFRTASRG